MANHKSAEKRMRQALVRRDRNRSARAAMRTEIKKLRTAIEQGNADEAKGMLASTLGMVDATAKKGVIHHNAAARTKSRLTRAVNGMA